MAVLASTLLLGLMLALLTGLRERLDGLSAGPAWRDVPILLLTSSLLALAFSGLAGREWLGGLLALGLLAVAIDATLRYWARHRARPDAEALVTDHAVASLGSCRVPTTDLRRLATNSAALRTGSSSVWT